MIYSLQLMVVDTNHIGKLSVGSTRHIYNEHDPINPEGIHDLQMTAIITPTRNARVANA